ncbi:MAG: hypothetical protein AB7U20_14250 [Planctomycetaceae bacterium]
MTARDRWIHRHLRRLHFGQFLQRAAEWLAAYLVLFGTAVLTVKLLIPAFWPHVMWVAAGVIPVTALAWWWSRAGRFTRMESVALLDQSLGAGGLLMTLTEAPHTDWEARLPQVERVWRESLPRIRPRRFAGSLALPAGFAVAACFVPLRETAATPVVKNTAGQQATSELQALLEALEEADVLAKQDEESLQEAIDKLHEETALSPLTHEKWETVDALEQRMRMQLAEAGAEMGQAAHAAAILAKAAQEDGKGLSAERQAELEQQVLDTLQKLSQSGRLSGGAEAQSGELQRLMKSGELRLPKDGEVREKLLSELQDFLEQESEKLSELRKQCEGSEGKEGQCAHCGKECEGGVCATCSGNRPGKGGVTRGRGDAELTWGDEADDAGVKFKETVLPPGLQDAPKEEILDVTYSAPEVDPAAAAARSAARTVEPSAGRETWERTLRPRHREVVRQYFNSAGN